MPEYSKDEIGRRTRLSERIFYQIEDNLNDFLDYVPFDPCHLEVYSHRLVTIILEVGPEILSSFDINVNIMKDRFRLGEDNVVKDSEELWKKEERLKKRRKSLTFFDYYRFLDKHSVPRLSAATILLEEFDAHLMPFEESNPEWWENYNLLRHDKYANLKTATLRTALKACSALFWLVFQNQALAGFSSDLFTFFDWGSLPSTSKKL